MVAPTIPARLFAQAKNRPNDPAYYVRGASDWVPTSWADYAGNVKRVAKALTAAGVESGQVICILGNNRPEWCEMDLGAMAINAIPAGIYQTCSAEEIAYILNHSEAPIILVENTDQRGKVESVRAELPHLKRIVMMSGADASGDDTLSWEDFLALGDEVDAAVIDDAVSKLEPSAPATFIYTSGTTGPPKAVMLSHDNLAWTADTAVRIVSQTNTDTSLVPALVAHRRANVHPACTHHIRCQGLLRGEHRQDARQPERGTAHGLLWCSTCMGEVPRWHLGQAQAGHWREAQVGKLCPKDRCRGIEASLSR